MRTEFDEFMKTGCDVLCGIVRSIVESEGNQGEQLSCDECQTFDFISSQLSALTTIETHLTSSIIAYERSGSRWSI